MLLREGFLSLRLLSLLERLEVTRTPRAFTTRTRLQVGDAIRASRLRLIRFAAWKKVTDAVHAKGGLIYTQLWALGRANADPPLHDHMPDVKTVAPSPIGLEPEYLPEELSFDDIKRALPFMLKKELI